LTVTLPNAPTAPLPTFIPGPKLAVVVALVQFVKLPVTITLRFCCVAAILLGVIEATEGTPASTVNGAVTTCDPVVTVMVPAPKVAFVPMVIGSDKLVGPLTVIVPCVRPGPVTVVVDPKFVPVPVMTIVSVAPRCAEVGVITIDAPAAVTVRLRVVVCVKAPDVPWMVTVVGPPVVAEAVAVSVRVLVVAVGFGLNDAVTPLGNVEVTARFTFPLNPPTSVTVIVLVLLLPWATLTVPGAADSEKLGAAVTVRLRVVVCVKAPEVP
jgi:hypothetical protein